MNLKIAQVIGLNTDQKAAQSTSAARDGMSFLAVLELSSDDAFTRGRQALSELADFFFEFEGEAADKLTAAFAEAEKLFGETDFDLVLAAVSGKVLYLVKKGAVEAYLRREGKLSPLAADTGSRLVSGFLKAGDRLMLSTANLVSFLGEDLHKSLDLPTDIFEEEVGGKIGASDTDNQGLAALVAEAVEDEEKEEVIPEQFHTAVMDDTAQKIPVPAEAIFTKALRLAGLAASYLPQSGRGRLAVAVILIAVTAGGAAYQYKASRDAGKQAQFNQLMAEAKDNFSAAKGIAGLNPADAKTKIDFVRDRIDKALALKPGEQEALELKKQLEAELPSILKQSEVADFPLFLDLDLVKKDFRADKFSLSAGNLLLLDPSSKTLVTVDLAKKSNQILSGSEKLGEAAFVSLNGESAFVYSKDKGILRIDTASQKLTTVAGTDQGWGDIFDIYGFAGNVYLLSKEQIWKYLPTAGGYSGKREYLSKGAGVDFSGSVRMQIESSVYVLKNGGEILRFTKGDKDNFSYAGLPASPAGGPSGVKDPKSIFVSSDTDNLYVLDSGNSRLLTLTKTGGYKGEITGNKFGTATDLVVDEVGKKVYLLEGSKIFQVDLK